MLVLETNYVTLSDISPNPTCHPVALLGRPVKKVSTRPCCVYVQYVTRGHFTECGDKSG